MGKLTDNQWEVLMHWLLTLVGGFMGVYAILLHAGNFGSAQTGNVMEMAAELVSMEWQKVLLRVIAFSIFLMRCCCGISADKLYKIKYEKTGIVGGCGWVNTGFISSP